MKNSIVTQIVERLSLTEIVENWNEYFDSDVHDEIATVDNIKELLTDCPQHTLMMFADYYNMIPNYL